jgi:hypothetical protein
MPFKSDAQRRWMYANKPAMAKRWQRHTPKGADLPERVKQAEPPPPKGVSCEEWDRILEGKKLPKRTKNAYLCGVKLALHQLGMTGE